MKNVKFLLSILLAGVLVLGSCASYGAPEKKIEFETLVSKEFELTSLVLSINANTDTNNQGEELIAQQFENILEAFQSVARSKNLEFNDTRFKESYIAGTLQFRMQVYGEGNFRINFYQWVMQSESVQRASIDIPFVITESGIPASVNLSVADPSNPEEPFRARITMPLQVVSN